MQPELIPWVFEIVKKMQTLSLHDQVSGELYRQDLGPLVYAAQLANIQTFLRPCLYYFHLYLIVFWF